MGIGIGDLSPAPVAAFDKLLRLEPVPGWYGKPLYPQRDVLIGPFGTINAAGSMLEGRHSGNMLMLAVGLDIDAYPWQADWYRGQVSAAKGEHSGDNFALLFTENSHHENPMTPLQRTHVVSYGGALQQALRDLAAWVEEGKRPLEVNYRIVDTQLVLPPTAEEIDRELAATHGNVVRAAQRLGLHPRQLYRLLERFSINLDRYRG